MLTEKIRTTDAFRCKHSILTHKRNDNAGSRKVGPQGILANVEDIKLLDWVFVCMI
jgi:hypothetical protein